MIVRVPARAHYGSTGIRTRKLVRQASSSMSNVQYVLQESANNRDRQHPACSHRHSRAGRLEKFASLLKLPIFFRSYSVLQLRIRPELLTTAELLRAAKRLNVELRENVAGPWYEAQVTSSIHPCMHTSMHPLTSKNRSSQKEL